jgi:hypothetical protein
VGKLKDPLVRNNNSYGMRGIFSGSHPHIPLQKDISNLSQFNYSDLGEGDITQDTQSKGNLSSRGEKVRRILENTEKYEKI